MPLNLGAVTVGPMARVRLLISILLAMSFVLLANGRALATCHSFTVSVSPESVVEGASVTVSVARNAGVNPSSVQVTSADETATSGADYDKVDRRIEFTTDTRQTFALATQDDSSPEGNETFLLRVGNGSGCPVSPEFQYGQAARVTIHDNDSASSATGVLPAQGKIGTTESGPAVTASEVSPLSQIAEEIADPNGISSTNDRPSTYLPNTFPFARKAQEGSPLTMWMIAAILAMAVAGGMSIAWWLWRKSFRF